MDARDRRKQSGAREEKDAPNLSGADSGAANLSGAESDVRRFDHVTSSKNFVCVTSFAKRTDRVNGYHHELGDGESALRWI